MNEIAVKATSGASDEKVPEGRYDYAERRASVRRGRERGCWVYIPAVELEKTGFDPYGAPPFYRTWGDARGRIVVQLYRTKGAGR